MNLIYYITCRPYYYMKTFLNTSKCFIKVYEPNGCMILIGLTFVKVQEGSNGKLVYQLSNNYLLSYIRGVKVVLNIYVTVICIKRENTRFSMDVAILISFLLSREYLRSLHVWNTLAHLRKRTSSVHFFTFSN